ncbi:glycoside hydrolase family 3 protein [Clostridium sp. Marseille-P299]|uniref:glycoside hydrolase family 3 protein n=1 Tax=Clostridium sp. Marseille-P299 TaxID=1805477 RepID=UPI0008376F0D|nr:glycoside hydrolase family 3 N-terminal domain-containing protein [Clostridium sp. Marseille-P299]
MKLNKLKNSFIPLFLLLLVFLFCVGGLLEFGKANQLNHPQKGNLNENQTDVNQGNGSSSNSEENSDASENSGKDKNTNEDMNTTDGSNESTSVVNSQIQELIDTMTLEEKVGQLFFVRCDESTAVEDVSNYNLGGFILFANNFENKTKEDLMNNIKAYQEASKIPMLIGVDEEGGTVVRVSKFKEFRDTPFLSPRALYAKGGLKLIIEDAYEKAELLKGLGINVNLAPVCDLSFDVDDYMYDRAFGVSVDATSEYVSSVVCIMNKKKLGSVLKHFPGYGNNEDTHTGIAYDNRSYETFETKDFLPFEAGIKAGANSILVSHNIVKSMDEKMPASLSKEVHNILRQELKFDGVIMTDDLSMDAITSFTDGMAAAVTAVNAGNDLLIATDYKTQIPAVIEAVKNGVIKEETIDKAVFRVLTWKDTLGLLEE